VATPSMPVANRSTLEGSGVTPGATPRRGYGHFEVERKAWRKDSKGKNGSSLMEMIAPE
jgi:hypothetical protein